MKNNNVPIFQAGERLDGEETHSCSDVSMKDEKLFTSAPGETSHSDADTDDKPDVGSGRPNKLLSIGKDGTMWYKNPLFKKKILIQQFHLHKKYIGRHCVKKNGYYLKICSLSGSFRLVLKKRVFVKACLQVRNHLI